MKCNKIIMTLAIAMMAVCTLQAATVSSRLRIKLSGDVGTSYGSVMLRVADEAAYASAFPNTGSSTAYDIDAYVNGTYYAEWQATAENMQNIAIAVNPAVGATNCTLTFTLGNSNTETFTLYDAVAEELVTISASNQTYDFAVDAANSRVWINDRFIINPAATGDPNICHEYGKLVVTDYVGDVVVSDMQGNEELRKSVMINASIDLSNLAAGQHRVAFNGKNLIIRVQ